MIEMPYTDKPAQGTLARGTCLATLNVRDVPALLHIDDTLRHALANPIGLDQPLSKTIQPGETVAIVVADSFRQTRVDQILPVLVDELVLVQKEIVVVEQEVVVVEEKIVVVEQ